MHAEMLEYAKRVAYAVAGNRNPEIGSIAGIMTHIAVREFDPAKGVPLKSWVRFCVKRAVHDYNRSKAKRREVQADESAENLWQNWLYTEDEACELLIPREDYTILCDRYFDKYPWDVVAKLHGVTVRRAKELVASAERKLKEAFDGKDR